MPLRCIKNNQNFYSFNLNDKEWEALRKENKQTDCLRFKCCDSKVKLTQSSLGTKFFAHLRKGECTSEPESKEHLLAKEHIVEGIKRTGWDFETEANPEKCDITPIGREWQADVLATKNKAKIAFEVQWSRQDKAETIRRQNRYKESDVRCLWLFKQSDFISNNKDTPAFQIRLDSKNKSFDVYMPSSCYREEKAKENSDYWLPPMSLQDFVEGCLAGKLKFAPAIGQKIPLEIFTSEVSCMSKWCKKTINIITELTFRVDKVMPYCPFISADVHTKGIEKWLLEWLSIPLLKSHNIGRLKVRKSWMENEEKASYFSNGCIHCDSIFPEYYEYYEEETLPQIKLNVLFTKELADLFWQQNVAYWWFDRKSTMES